MAVIKELTQDSLRTLLVCPQGKHRVEVVDPLRTGLYIEVRASNQGQGTYYLCYKDASQKTSHLRLGRTDGMTLEEARAEAIRQKGRLKSQQTGAPSAPAQPASQPSISAVSAQEGPAVTLDVFMADYYFPYAKQHKRSWKRDEQIYARIKGRFGHVPLKAITRREVEQFQASLASEGLAPATVNHHAVLLRTVLNWAVKWEMLERNVLSKFQLMRLDNQRNDYLDDAQVDRLVNVLKTDENRMVSLILMYLLSTGARLNEGLQAQWRHIDVDNERWRIPAGNSKSRREKHFPLNKAALWVLDQLETQNSDYVFPSPVTGKPYTTITRQWYRIRRKAGIPAKFRIHDLRHTFASRLVSAGRSLFEVQTLLGHADPRTSQRYAHLSMKAQRDASNAAAFAIG